MPEIIQNQSNLTVTITWSKWTSQRLFSHRGYHVPEELRARLSAVCRAAPTRRRHQSDLAGTDEEAKRLAATDFQSGEIRRNCAITLLRANARGHFAPVACEDIADVASPETGASRSDHGTRTKLTGMPPLGLLFAQAVDTAAGSDHGKWLYAVCARHSTNGT